MFFRKKRDPNLHAYNFGVTVGESAIQVVRQSKDKPDRTTFILSEIFAFDYGSYLTFHQEQDKRKAIMDGYYSIIHKYFEPRVLNNFLDEYVIALRDGDPKNPLGGQYNLVGKVYAKNCGEEGNPILISKGALHFKNGLDRTTELYDQLKYQIYL